MRPVKFFDVIIRDCENFVKDIIKRVYIIM